MTLLLYTQIVKSLNLQEKHVAKIVRKFKTLFLEKSDKYLKQLYNDYYRAYKGKPENRAEIKKCFEEGK